MDLATPKVGAKHELLFDKPASENISRTQAAHQRVTKIISMTTMNSVTPKVGARHELLFDKLVFVENISWTQAAQ